MLFLKSQLWKSLPSSGRFPAENRRGMFVYGWRTLVCKESKPQFCLMQNWGFLTVLLGPVIQSGDQSGIC